MLKNSFPEQKGVIKVNKINLGENASEKIKTFGETVFCKS